MIEVGAGGGEDGVGAEANALRCSHMDLQAREIIHGINVPAPPPSPGRVEFEKRKAKNRILGKC